jgi:hypothetical protein
MTPSRLRGQITARLRNAKRGTVVYIRSGSRGYRFYWYMKTHRLAVHVSRYRTRRFSVPCNLIADELVAQLSREPRSCPRCDREHHRRGKFCSKTCGTAWRVAKHRHLAGRRKRAEARLAERSRPDIIRELEQREREVRARDRRVRKAIHKFEDKRLRRGDTEFGFGFHIV